MVFKFIYLSFDINKIINNFQAYNIITVKF